MSKYDLDKVRAACLVALRGAGRSLAGFEVSTPESTSAGTAPKE